MHTYIHVHTYTHVHTYILHCIFTLVPMIRTRSRGEKDKYSIPQGTAMITSSGATGGPHPSPGFDQSLGMLGSVSGPHLHGDDRTTNHHQFYPVGHYHQPDGVHHFTSMLTV